MNASSSFGSRSLQKTTLWPKTSLVTCLFLVACAQGVGSDPDADLGQDGTAAVVDGGPEISDAGQPDACVQTEETCDGTDEDCDGRTDEGFAIGEACDSDDADACTDDLSVCAPNGLETVCSDQGPALPDLCNSNTNDDCRADTPDGSTDPSVGLACDGSDSDLCEEGTMVCSEGSLVCSDQSGSTADLCNGSDDDCDPSSADGSEDPSVGILCDGADGDLCKEGTLACSGGALICNDLTTTTLDLCNSIDDDCDPSSANGSEDPQSGAACDGSDTDFCNEGVLQCSGSNLVCSDQTGNNVEVCNGSDDDCNGSVDEGTRNTNPLCASASFLGSVSGDLGPDILSASGSTEQWFRLTITEDSFTTSSYLSATVQLDSPPNMDFDLLVHCESCSGGLAGTSALGTDLVDTVGIRREDGSSDESFDVFIEVRFFGATACDTWDLVVTSDTAVAAETCPAP